MVHEAICSLFSDYAYEVLLSKLMLTQKAGLVDRRNSGAHRDMCVLVCMPNSQAPGAPCQTMANPIALVGTGFGVHVPALDIAQNALLRVDKRYYQKPGFLFHRTSTDRHQHELRCRAVAGMHHGRLNAYVVYVLGFLISIPLPCCSSASRESGIVESA